jgi:hypothetical protein
MKTIYSILVALLFIFFTQASCENDNENSDSDGLIGKWEYIGYLGGIAGWSPYEGSPIYYKFNNDSFLTIMKEDTSNFKTEFKVIEGNSSSNNMEWDTIHFLQTDSELAEYELFHVQGDTLKMRLPEDNSDYWGQINYFERIK